ncbi:hypothetical protein [Nocardia xishanensis]|uniref:hypothetical protein n=1 Tax=Nocardia xishanensis TaxID=238964 RepID=UPI0012F47820|nr:hypothetical protein [Nocardia xishanensis]
MTGKVSEAPAGLSVIGPVLADQLAGPDLLAREHADLARWPDIRVPDHRPRLEHCGR